MATGKNDPIWKDEKQLTEEPIDGVVGINPKTGKMELLPPQIDDGEESFFTDDEKSDAPTTHVLFRNKRVDIRELDDEQKEYYNGQTKLIEKLGTEAEELARGVAANRKAANEATQKRLKELAESIPKTQLALDEWVIETAVRKWALPRPYSQAEAMKLHRSHKAELANLIVAKSQMGRTAADFLSES